MKCYNHHTHDALGICKNCHKGICIDCLTDTGNGIACHQNCKEYVESLNYLGQRQLKLYKNTRNIYLQRTLFYIAFCVFFAIMGFQIKTNLTFQIALYAMAILFLMMSISSLRQSKSIDGDLNSN